MGKITVRDIDVRDKKVLLRADFNVPMKDGVITDDNRIKEEIPTINFLLEKGASIILCSHLGRPEGQVNMKYSLAPVAERLQNLLPETKVVMANDVVGADAKSKAKDLKPGEILLLENVRFESGEEENSKELSKKLANLGDIYVNDAFGTAHRKHASTYGIAMLRPNAIGFLIEKELNMITGQIDNPKRPMVAILGGAKVKDKIGIVKSLLGKANSIIIGGGMAFTFLKAQGLEIGKSLCDDEQLEYCKEILAEAKEKGVNILLPVDTVVADSIDSLSGDNLKEVNIPADKMGVDIGKKTIKQFVKTIKKAKTVIWNGPMGVFENDAFNVGTYKVAKAVAKCHGTTIIGGGDSVSAIVNMGLSKKISHLSTGGGASLKLFEGKVLPAVDIIENKII
jgi:phosphoglycerate kinase